MSDIHSPPKDFLPSRTSTAAAGLSRSVCKAITQQPIESRGIAFREMYQECERCLQELVGTKRPVIMTNANGTQMMELVSDNLVGSGDTVLVINAGEFGSRWAEILRCHGARVIEMIVPVGTLPDSGLIRGYLEIIQDLRACFIVHCETSVGTLCDLPSIAAQVRQLSPDTLIVVDAMTSVVSHEIRFDEWEIDALFAASHKVIGGPIGVGFVALSERAFASCQSTSVSRYCGNVANMMPFHEKGQSQFALPQNVMFGFAAALKLIFDAGPERCRDLIKQQAEITRSFIQAAGLKLVSAASANAVTCFWLPGNVKASDLVSMVMEKHQVHVATGRKDEADRIVRIGHLGISFSEKQLKYSLNCMLNCLNQLADQAL